MTSQRYKLNPYHTILDLEYTIKTFEAVFGTFTLLSFRIFKAQTFRKLFEIRSPGLPFRCSDIGCVLELC